MSKNTAIILLGFFVVVLPASGFPGWVRDTFIVISGLSIVALAYLSSVVYCSNCKKLIDDSDKALPVDSKETTPTL